MRIDIALENKHDDTVLALISKEGNVDYLVKGENNPDFPYLGEVESYDYSTFGRQHMDKIIKELKVVRETLNDTSDQQHIDDIVNLAKRCKNTPDTVLVFAG